MFTDQNRHFVDPHPSRLFSSNISSYSKEFSLHFFLDPFFLFARRYWAFVFNVQHSSSQPFVVLSFFLLLIFCKKENTLSLKKCICVLFQNITSLQKRKQHCVGLNTVTLINWLKNGIFVVHEFLKDKGYCTKLCVIFTFTYAPQKPRKIHVLVPVFYAISGHSCTDCTEHIL